MRRVAFVVAVSLVLANVSFARADCADPDALGTARVITVDPREHRRIGTMQYDESLPLADKEVVLTFDDGPIPPYSLRVLEALAAECVKATYFVVGQQARAHPELVRRLHDEGHTVGTHTDSHPGRFDVAAPETIAQEIDAGIAAAAAALGSRTAVAPFFRFPGLRRSSAGEAELAARGLMAWSADMPADDWMRISADMIIARALERLESRRKGVLLLHDIQPATALAVPRLLRELKARGFRIVHVVPADGAHPATVTASAEWRAARPRARARLATRLPIASPDSFGWPRPYRLDLKETADLRGSLAAPGGAIDEPGPVWHDLADSGLPSRYVPTLPDDITGSVVARSDEALGSMVRRPRPRRVAPAVPALATAEEPQAQPEPPRIFGLFRLPFFGLTP